MPAITVVVPVYDVEDYLEACLRSIAAQTVGDLEVVMVDDGSTDSSPAIAERFAREDPRFTLLRQPNAGLGAARNTGIDAASGEYLAFVDSDDVLPPDAYERLLGALERTGSDFATGGVQRITPVGIVPVGFLAQVHARTRLGTHVRRFDPLLRDRTAWNKLWRRAFWNGHGLRFPEGCLHEDIPVVLPAHFLAASVDVVAAPVYQWRLRDGGGASITQRAHEVRALEDRFNAVEQVWRFLDEHESAAQRRWYERSVVADDLLRHLDQLDQATDAYRAAFMHRAAAFLATADPATCDRLAPLDRAKWQLVREDRLPELLELLRLQRDDAARPPAPAAWLLRRIPARHRARVPVALRGRLVQALKPRARRFARHARRTAGTRS